MLIVDPVGGGHHVGHRVQEVAFLNNDLAGVQAQLEICFVHLRISAKARKRRLQLYSKRMHVSDEN